MDPDRLARLPLFADLDDAARAEIAACVREVTLEPNTTLAAQGDNAYEFFVIEDGQAEVRKDGEVIGSVGQGDVVGEIGLLATGARTATVVSTTPMTLVAMFAREFRQVEKSTPAIAKTLRETMRERVARTSF